MGRLLLYEINIRRWLSELSEEHDQTVTLGNVPDGEITGWKKEGFTHIWLMGVWKSGPRARNEALAAAKRKQSYSETLPDWSETDIGASPYAIADYCVAEALGGEHGLRQFRRQLHADGLKLLLDFVPNHVGLDHPWLKQQPDLFVQSP